MPQIAYLRLNFRLSKELGTAEPIYTKMDNKLVEHCW